MIKIVLGLLIGGCVAATPLGNSAVVSAICGFMTGVR